MRYNSELITWWRFFLMLRSVFRTAIELLRHCSLMVMVPQEWFHREL